MAPTKDCLTDSTSSAPSISSRSTSSLGVLTSDTDYTHAFPSKPQPKRKGLSAETTRLAQILLHPERDDVGVDRHVVLMSGLPWLANSAKECEERAAASSTQHYSLSKQAVCTFNASENVKKQEERAAVDNGSLAGTETADFKRAEAWVSNQTRSLEP